MKTKKLSLFLSGLILFCISIFTISSSAQAAIVTEDVIITEVGVWNGIYYRVKFEYDTFTYTKYIERDGNSDLYATALTALSLGGAASCKFDDAYLNNGWLYDIYAQL